MFLAVLGPDGCGKSTVIQSLSDSLPEGAEGVVVIHLRPSVLSMGSKNTYQEAVVNPYGKRKRGVIPSVFKSLYFLVDYLWGYWSKIKPLLDSSHFVIFDRYYHDMFLDPKRYRYGAPLWWARFVGRMIPEPDLFLVLDAPVEVIQGRKQEVSPAETQLQRDAYLAFAKGRKNCIVVDTGQDLERTLCQVSAAVSACMVKRPKAQMGGL